MTNEVLGYDPYADPSGTISGVHGLVEHRVIGPPGTGKTTYLARQCQRAVNAWCDRTGGSGDQCTAVLVSSLTRAATEELRSRGLSIAHGQVGTLHAHAWRAIGRPDLCVDKKGLDDWNGSCLPAWRITATGRAEPDQADRDERSVGDDLLERYHTYRGRLTPRTLWTLDVQAFAREYESWKRVSHKVDFSDAIDLAADLDHAPEWPEVIFVDEAQDCSAAELRLVRKWSTHPTCHQLVVIGDPDQNLYEWRGSDQAAFYAGDIPEENYRVLSQSYRVPQAVHAEAMGMIGRVANRREWDYRPTDETGSVTRAAETIFRDADDVVGMAVEASTRGTVMILTACNYQLNAVLSALRESGAYFWNPYKRDNGSWNPYTASRGVSTLDRLGDYLWEPSGQGQWSYSQVDRWTDLLRVEGVLVRGAKTEISAAADQYRDAAVSQYDLDRWFEPEALLRAMAGDLSLVKNNAKAAKLRAIELAVNCYKRNGEDVFRHDPKIIVGTIHSVKGGEADTVILAPDLSPNGFDCLESRNPDSIFRQFYVGITRAKRDLVLLSPDSARAIEW